MFAYLVTQFKRSTRLFWSVAKVMLPVMVLVELAQAAGLVDWVGRAIAPAMGLMHLPPEAGIVWATTVLVGIFGGIASLSALAGTFDMTAAQLSALAAMMLFAHALPVEQAIVRRAGASFWITGALRLGTAILYGAGVSWLCASFDLLSTPVSLEWLRGSTFTQESSGITGWLMATSVSLGITFTIIVVLVIILDALDRLGITRRITAALTPVLRISGLSADVAPVTTVGVLLGLTYGGALIIEEAEKKNFPKRTRFLALSWLSLSHSLIEDTLLLVALGADIWVVLVGRVVITLIIVAALARITNRGSWERTAAESLPA